MLLESGDQSESRGNAVTGHTVNLNLDRELSLQVAKRVRAQFRRCWRNAAIGIRHLGPNAEYVEGWIVVERSAPLVVEHGWCEVDGRVIEFQFDDWMYQMDARTMINKAAMRKFGITFGEVTLSFLKP